MRISQTRESICPWGNYRVLFKGPDYQVKRIEIKPGLRFSLQKHMKRAETWVVVEGHGTATIGKKQAKVTRGSIVRVAVRQVHRMHNTGKRPLVLIEVQLGDYLGEDDILRLEDDFDRALAV